MVLGGPWVAKRDIQIAELLLQAGAFTAEFDLPGQLPPDLTARA